MAAPNSVVLAFALILLAPLGAKAAGVREDRPNLVGGEVLGRGIIITANYERFLTNRFGLGVGTGLGISGSVYASFVPGETHSLYLSAGGAFLNSAVGFVDQPKLILILQESIGYQFQSKRGFFVRPIAVFNQYNDVTDRFRFVPWPGVTIGGSF